MKIIHTADWHLGQYFKGEHSRDEEHRAFLAWLLQLLQTEQPDALLVAGDIFDSANPRQYVLADYYRFLSQAQAFCPTIIITGGNHDSSYVLDAPRELLQYLNIHLIGGGAKIDSGDMGKQIVPISDKGGNMVGAVAAVPFLREGEVRQVVAAAESQQDKVLLLREGIKTYYAQCLALLQDYITQGLPIIAMGHLYAAGSQLSDEESSGRSERRIYATMGNQSAIDTDIFPAAFQYVALGHIHQPQIVGKKAHIRYSGSPIPLSFGELNDRKQVVAVSFTDNQVSEIRPIEIPLYRKLLRLSGTPEQLAAKIALLNIAHDEPTAWVEIKVQVAAQTYAIEQQIVQLLADKNIKVLGIRYEKIDEPNASNPSNSLHDQLNRQEIDLEDIISQPNSVFLQRCEHINPEEKAILQQTFDELMATIEQ